MAQLKAQPRIRAPDRRLRIAAPRRFRLEETRWVDPLGEPPDPALVLSLPPAFLLSAGLLPWRR